MKPDRVKKAANGKPVSTSGESDYDADLPNTPEPVAAGEACCYEDRVLASGIGINAIRSTLQIGEQGAQLFTIRPGQIVQHCKVMTPRKLDKAHGLPGLATGTGVLA